MRTRIAGFSARISRVASMPEPSGRRISMMTRSGRCVRAASIASAAVPTWATTVKAGRRSSSATSPSRTTSWSSTTRSRRTEGGFVSIKGGTCPDGSSDRGADRGPVPSYALREVTPLGRGLPPSEAVTPTTGQASRQQRWVCPRSTDGAHPRTDSPREGGAGRPARGGRTPRFALGQPQHDRPMLSLRYLVVRALVRLLVSAGRAGRVDRVDALFAPVTIMPSCRSRLRLSGRAPRQRPSLNEDIGAAHWLDGRRSGPQSRSRSGESLGHFAGMDTGVPDVAHGEGGDD